MSKLSFLMLAGVMAGGAGASQAWAQSDMACPPPPEPVLSLSYQSRYEPDDASRSILDEEAEEEAEDALRPVDDFLRSLSQRSDAIQEATPADKPGLADCLIGQIARWADADALSDQQTDTAQLGVGSRLASFAMMTALASPQTARQDDVDKIGDWLARRVHEQMIFWETAPDGAAQGNLRAWAGLAASAVAGLVDDPVIRAWAVWSTRYVLCTASPDGSLPQEMSRGRLALHYQLHALAPLVTSVVLLTRQGVPLRAECDNALDRAVVFALSDLKDGAKSEAITGEVQGFFDGSRELKDFHLAWIEAYVAMTADPVAEAIAATRRPLRYSKLGGDQTLIWRR